MTEAGVHLANQIIARMGSRDIAAILPRAERTKTAPGELPVTATLAVDPVIGPMAKSGEALRGRTQTYQREMLEQLPVLRLVSARIADDGFPVTECRLLDLHLMGPLRHV